MGTGYRLEFDKSEYSITRPNDLSSLLTQAVACDVLILYGRYDIDISDNSLALLRMIAQGPGFPTILFGVTGLDELPPAKRMAARRRLQSNFEAHNIIPSGNISQFYSISFKKYTFSRGIPIAFAKFSMRHGYSRG